MGCLPVLFFTLLPWDSFSVNLKLILSLKPVSSQDLPVSPPPHSPPLTLAITWVTGAHSHVWLSCECQGFKLSSSCLYSKDSYLQSHFPPLHLFGKHLRSLKSLSAFSRNRGMPVVHYLEILSVEMWNSPPPLPQVSYPSLLIQVYYMTVPTSVPLLSVIKEAGLRPLHSIVGRQISKPTVSLTLAWVEVAFF